VRVSKAANSSASMETPKRTNRAIGFTLLHVPDGTAAGTYRRFRVTVKLVLPMRVAGPIDPSESWPLTGHLLGAIFSVAKLGSARPPPATFGASPAGDGRE
jgi:hypothetical protein